MSKIDLIKEAKLFATQAHQRIGHKRKYTKQPYEVHLREVAHIVSTVTGDPEMIAAAWLHDTVEDTAATHRDIEQHFGAGVRQLVFELTDISKPSDGNRAKRKRLDRRHLSQASQRAKTIKLADLIDNTRDICKHDPRFARTYHAEAVALMKVLGDGDPALYKWAEKELSRCADKLGVEHPIDTLDTTGGLVPALLAESFSQRRVQRLFTESFTAKDIAEPLPSFDTDSPASVTREKMERLGIEVAGVRDNGQVTGYVWRDDLKDQLTGAASREFGPDQSVYGDATLSDVILVLTRYDNCFIYLLGSVAGMVTRADIEKPIVRMWLFGMITILEMSFTDRIRKLWPDNSWTPFCSKGRLIKAQELCVERNRLNQHSDLADCLQLADKAQLLARDPETLASLGFTSKAAVERAVKSLTSLRNNLAHGQSIVAYDWPQIVRITQRLEKIIAAL